MKQHKDGVGHVEASAEEEDAGVTVPWIRFKRVNCKSAHTQTHAQGKGLCTGCEGKSLTVIFKNRVTSVP